MPLLFSYGTLQQDDVQLSTFGRLLTGRMTELVGFEQLLVEIDDPEVVATSGKTYHPIIRFTGSTEHRIAGVVFEVTADELAHADEYEAEAYRRILVDLASGEKAWVYVDALSPEPHAVTTRQLPDALAVLTAKTLEHYNESAADFWEGTRDHDVTQNIDALLRHVHGAPPLRILDFGCGPGRDLMAFRALGHEPIGLEGSPRLAGMAREHSGCEVWEQDFLALKLPAESFDGIFANASLFHVPSRELPRVLCELHAALKRDGVLFASNPRGENQEGWNHGRYGAYHDLESWRAFLEAAAFEELEHYYRPPGLPRERQPWLASIWRKKGAATRRA